MQLSNTSPVPAQSIVFDHEDRRFSSVTAKATFNFDGELETQDPTPLFAVDEPTDLGLLPADAHARFDDAFEVITLGRAYSPGGRKCTRRLVSLTVGVHTRHLHVCGDRRWISATISEPEPFTSLPLTYERAFGGRCDLYLDAESPLEVTHPLNALGKGFDPEPSVVALRRELRLPSGLPYVAYERTLPNVEDPQNLVARTTDNPDPASWATVPREIGLCQLRAVRREVSVNLALAHRAHPTWIVSRPAANATVKLTGLTPNGGEEFRLPQLRIFADTEQERRELCPQMLVLLPEQRRLYVLYRTVSPFAAKGARLRLEPGWAPPDLKPSGSPSEVQREDNEHGRATVEDAEQ